MPHIVFPGGDLRQAQDGIRLFPFRRFRAFFQLERIEPGLVVLPAQTELRNPRMGIVGGENDAVAFPFPTQHDRLALAYPLRPQRTLEFTAADEARNIVLVRFGIKTEYIFSVRELRRFIQGDSKRFGDPDAFPPLVSGPVVPEKTVARIFLRGPGPVRHVFAFGFHARVADQQIFRLYQGDPGQHQQGDKFFGHPAFPPHFKE